MTKIGIVVFATNKYIKFLDPLIKSVEKYFLPDYQKTIFAFTNVNRKDAGIVKYIYLEHKPWPLITLFRYKTIYENRNYFKDVDYIYYIDVDMRVVNKVDDEILGTLVAVKHPSDDLHSLMPYEKNKQSTAYMGSKKNDFYYCGGVQGGERDSYLNAAKQLAKNIDQDYEKNIIAIWHDETHWNKYLSEQKSFKSLSNYYAYNGGTSHIIHNLYKLLPIELVLALSSLNKKVRICTIFKRDGMRSEEVQPV